MDTPTYDIYLINGNITVFCGAHDENFKKDILYSSLLGDLITTSKRLQSPEQIFSSYANEVGRFGWIQNSREMKRCELSSNSLFKTIETGIGTSLTKEEKQRLYNAFMQLKKPPTQSPVIKTVLDRLLVNSFTPGHEMHVGVSTKAPVATSTRLTIVRNNASILTLQVAFKTTNGISMDILDQPVLNAIRDGKTNMWLLVSSLDVREYDKIRAAVIKKAGNHVNTDLLHVQTPNQVN